MLMKEQELKDAGIDRNTQHYTTAFFILTTLLMCESEFDLIRLTWFKVWVSFDFLNAFVFPFGVLAPYLSGVSMLFIIGRLGKKGKIDSAIVVRLNFYLSLLLMMSYLAIFLLASQCKVLR